MPRSRFLWAWFEAFAQIWVYSLGRSLLLIIKGDPDHSEPWAYFLPPPPEELIIGGLLLLLLVVYPAKALAAFVSRRAGRSAEATLGSAAVAVIGVSAAWLALVAVVLPMSAGQFVDRWALILGMAVIPLSILCWGRKQPPLTG